MADKRRRSDHGSMIPLRKRDSVFVIDVLGEKGIYQYYAVF